MYIVPTRQYKMRSKQTQTQTQNQNQNQKNPWALARSRGVSEFHPPIPAQEHSRDMRHAPCLKSPSESSCDDVSYRAPWRWTLTYIHIFRADKNRLSPAHLRPRHWIPRKRALSTSPWYLGAEIPNHVLSACKTIKYSRIWNQSHAGRGPEAPLWELTTHEFSLSALHACDLFCILMS